MSKILLKRKNWTGLDWTDWTVKSARKVLLRNLEKVWIRNILQPPGQIPVSVPATNSIGGGEISTYTENVVLVTD